MTSPEHAPRRDPMGMVTVVAHVVITCVGIICVTALAVSKSLDGATAGVIIVAALGIGGPALGRPPQGYLGNGVTGPV